MFFDWIVRAILRRYLPASVLSRLWPFIEALLKLQQKGEVTISDEIGDFIVSLQVRKRGG